MSHRAAYPVAILALSALWVTFVAVAAPQAVDAGASGNLGRAQSTHPSEASPSEMTYTVHLPLVMAGYPAPQWFGVESNVAITSGVLFTRLQELGVSWVRLGSRRVSWRELQPNEGDPLRWDIMAGFEDELRALKQAGIVPRVIVMDSPRWATVTESSCAAIRTDKLPAFASFVGALVARYRTDEFGVHDWEIGNEPDVDPSLVPADNGFGCWGNIADPFYGGQHYGEMLKVVGPAIRTQDPSARIWIGGLLLDRPLTTDSTRGRPELFLQGILEAGAAPWFDVLPYHAYPTYTGLRVDMDNAAGGRWDALGGYVVGKAGFLRQLLQTYHVSKPLVVNEAGLICSGSAPFSQWCTDEQIGRYYEMQADHLVRSFVRGIGAGVQGFVWYTLEAPGWMRSSLLDTAAEPRQAFAAYQFLNAQLMDALYLGPAVYTDTVESYAFRRAGARVHVLWARQDITVPVAVPQAELADARDRQGNAIALITDGSVCTVPVGFSPVYLTLTP